MRQTGAAGIDPDTGVASITIEGGNEPHGVFGFAASAVQKRVGEGDGTVQLAVDRKFGNIGQTWGIMGHVGLKWGIMGNVCQKRSSSEILARS